jgi:hypothetical protein
MGGSDGPMSRWLSNKGCGLCREAAAKVIHETTWWRNKCPPPSPARYAMIFHAQAGTTTFQKDGKKELCFAVRTVGFTAKLFCSKRQLE